MARCLRATMSPPYRCALRAEPQSLEPLLPISSFLKPAPHNIRELYLQSLELIGLDIKNNDVRFVEDDWENPTVGAAGLGFEVWFNGMEITQFTYMQQVGGIECKLVAGEITYGLERIAMHVQDVDSVFDINWNGVEGEGKITYGDVFLENEKQNSAFMLEHSNKEVLLQNFADCEKMAQVLIAKKLPIPAYEQALKTSHLLNLLDARGAISATERANYIARVRNLVKAVCQESVE